MTAGGLLKLQRVDCARVYCAIAPCGLLHITEYANCFANAG